jgi:pimeloyl-ACP methyl ester carboxylesterase
MEENLMNWKSQVTVVLICIVMAPAAAAGQPEFLPSIEETIRIDQWQFLGPFSVGYREGIQSAVANPAYLSPTAGMHASSDVPREYRSILPQGGLVTWKTVSPDSSGLVNIEFDNVYWDTIMDIYGYAGLVNKTFAFAEIEVPGERRALIVAERVGTFFLNAREHYGGPYGHDFVRVPVVLNKGKNRVVLSLTGFAGHRFRFEVLPVPAPVMLLHDYTGPDLFEQETGEFWAGVTVLNATSTGVKGATIRVGDGSAVAVREFGITDLAPLCVKKVPVRLEVTSPPGEVEEISVPVSVTHGDITHTDSMRLRLRTPGQSHKRTFISEIDGSCQYYAVLPPEGYEPSGDYALILSLHGAGVRAEGQVDAYKPKPWAFVVAPTNRRPFGFDWQDWGRLDALEVLDIALETMPIDPARVYLTGHSMGGHGAWHVGLNHADLFAAMAPEAGWTSFELYIPWFLQKGYIYGDPRQVGMRDLALREDKPLNFVENALNLPIFILHGGGDDNVPTMHSRMFAERLEALAYDYEYYEVPGRGHWWHDDSLDVSCVDYPRVMDFLESKKSKPDPRWVRLKTVNLATSSRAHWLEITRQGEPMKETYISAHVLGEDALGDQRVLISEARNVQEFRLRRPRLFQGADAIQVVVDGTPHEVNLREGETAVFGRRAGEFRPGPTNRSGLAKTAGLYGPIKQAYFSPFVLVYGTGRHRDVTLHQARSQAARWWRRGNGYVDVIPDTCVTDSVVANCNLILFGNRFTNSVLARIERDLPIQVGQDGVKIGSNMVSGACAAMFVYPNPLNPDKLVVVHAGTDRERDQILSDYFKTLYAGAGLPDYLIYDHGVLNRGWASVLCTGFFDSNWRVDPGLMFMAR